MLAHHEFRVFVSFVPADDDYMCSKYDSLDLLTRVCVGADEVKLGLMSEWLVIGSGSELEASCVMRVCYFVCQDVFLVRVDD